MAEEREEQMLVVNSTETLAHKLTLLYRGVHTNTSLCELTPYSLVRYTLYGFAINCGWPYAKPASLYAGSNHALGILYGSSAVISLGSIATWAILDYLEYIGLISHNTKNNKLMEVITAVTAFLLGAGSALPGLIISYRYNHNIPFLGLSFYLDASTNTCSLNRLFRELISDLRYFNQPALKNLRNAINSRLLSGAQHAISHNQVTEIDNFEQGMVTGDNFVTILQRTITASKVTMLTRQGHKNIYRRGRVGFIISVAVILPLSWEITTSYLVYEQLRNDQKWGKPGSGFVSGFTTIPTFILECIFASLVADKIYSTIANQLFGIGVKSAVIKNYPRIALPIMLVALFLVSFGFTAKAKIVDDLFADSIPKTILLVITIIGAIAYKSIAILTNTDTTIRNVAISKSSVNKPFIYEKSLEQIQIILENSQPDEVAEFIQKLEVETVLTNVPGDQDLSDSFQAWKKEKDTQRNATFRIPLLSNVFCCRRNDNDSSQALTLLEENPHNQSTTQEPIEPPGISTQGESNAYTI